MFHFSTYIFLADITPDMLKLSGVTKVKVPFLVLLYILNFNLFEFSAAILEKGVFLITGKSGLPIECRKTETKVIGHF